MYDFLINHAITNVWCTPQQDDQVVFAPQRISGPRGVIGTVNVLWESLPLPDTTSTYHVYQIGQVAPGLLDLLPDSGIWRLVAENMKDNNLIADVYLINGIQLPRIETYLLVNSDKNVLLAIKDQKPLVDLTQSQLFLRLYSNAYFSSSRDPASPDKVDIYGARITDTTVTLDLQRKYQDFQAMPGLTCAYVNGMLVDTFNPFVVPVGQVVEFVYDSSVKRVVEFPVEDLQTFTSVLDGKFKYLLHYPGLGDNIIDYLDDVDVYLINRNVPGPIPAFQGVYYHKNNIDAFRQVTHKDYSICVPYVVGYAKSVPGWNDPNQLTVRLHIRNSGYSRSLVGDVNRILDLYKLPENRLTEAMLGVNATLPNWQAENLENSPYTKLMGIPNSSDIDINLVQAAYGYGTISRVLGDSPIQVQNEGGAKYIDVPYGLQSGCTMFEYDSNGILLGFYSHPIGYIYQTVNASCAWVEGISGNGSAQLSTSHNGQGQILDPNQSYRFYICNLVGGQPSGNWQDVTGDNTKYTVSNNVVTWTIDFTQYTTQVRDDLNFLAYNYQSTPSDGLFIFSITSTEQWNGTYVNGVMSVPPGQITLYLNGHALVEDLDYFVTWPKVCVVNTSYLLYNEDGSLAQQTVTVVGTGFCNSDLSRQSYTDTGFVSYNVLSRNNYFNLRDDKVLKIAVNGGIYPRELLEFSEDYPASGMINIPNGVPYAISRVIVPTIDNTNQNTYSLFNADQPVDTAVEQYMTQYMQDTTESNPDEIPQLYGIYSPFCAKILYDLLNGVIDISPFTGQYSDIAVKTALAGYEYLLAYEPTYKDLDTAHVIVYPHNRNTVITLNIYQYNFLSRAVDVYLNDKVDLSHFIDILSTLI